MKASQRVRHAFAYLPARRVVRRGDGFSDRRPRKVLVDEAVEPRQMNVHAG
jgi:hypothetical protein